MSKGDDACISACISMSFYVHSACACFSMSWWVQFSLGLCFYEQMCSGQQVSVTLVQCSLCLCFYEMLWTIQPVSVSGITVSRTVLEKLVMRYGGRQRRIVVEDFILICSRLVSLYSQCKTLFSTALLPVPCQVCRIASTMCISLKYYYTLA